MNEQNYCRLVRWIGRLLGTERYFLIQESLVVGLGVVTVFFTPLLYFFIVMAFPMLLLGIVYGFWKNLLFFLIGIFYVVLNMEIVLRFLSGCDDSDRCIQIQNLNTTVAMFFPVGLFMLIWKWWKGDITQNTSELYGFFSWRFWLQEFIIIFLGVGGLFLLLCIILAEKYFFIGFNDEGVVGTLIIFYFFLSGCVFAFTKSENFCFFVKFINSLLIYWGIVMIYLVGIITVFE